MFWSPESILVTFIFTKIIINTWRAESGQCYVSFLVKKLFGTSLFVGCMNTELQPKNFFVPEFASDLREVHSEF